MRACPCELLFVYCFVSVEMCAEARVEEIKLDKSCGTADCAHEDCFVRVEVCTEARFEEIKLNESCGTADCAHEKKGMANSSAC